jgi:hypothetical protein
MAEKEIKPLSSKEYDAIGLALFEFINNYDKKPDGAELCYQYIRGAKCISFFTSPGGKYLKEYITGGFSAQLPFDIMYKLSATSNEHLLNAEEFLNGLADYLQEKPYPSLTDGREVEEIIMDSTTYRTKAEDDGSVQFARSGVLKYRKD